MLNRPVQAAFNRAAEHYDAVATTQSVVAARLFELLQLQRLPAPRRILDAGCGTGGALVSFREAWPASETVALDFAPAMLAAAGKSAVSVCGNLERLPIRNCSIDLYWSSLAIQWCELSRAVAEAVRVLRPGGTLAVTTLSVLTFAELRAAFAGIDSYGHTLEFLEPDAIEAEIRRGGFAQLSRSRLMVTEHHQDLRTLLRRVKATGANQISGRRRPGLLGRHAFAEAERRYEAFRAAEGLPLPYDVVMIIARRS
ncbi:MAG TPA: methyltransferase domain-containing protein [Rhodocyclaceae bacterium]